VSVHPDLKTVVQVIICNYADHVGAIYVSQFSPSPTLEDAAAFLTRLDPEITRLELWRGVQMNVYTKTNNDEWRKETR
jgi:hypothetical protein